MTMEKRNLIEDKRTPAFAKQASEDELEKSAVDMFKGAKKESDPSDKQTSTTSKEG